MEVIVLDTLFRDVAIIDVFESLIWTDRYNEAGDFELYTYANSNTFATFQKDYYLYFKESNHLMIIDQVEIKTDAENGNRLIINGESLEKILDRRIVWNETEIYGNLQNGIKKLINENIINPSIANRKIANFVFNESTDPAITSLVIDNDLDSPYKYYGEDLYSVISSLCQEFEIGFKIEFDSNNQFIFSLYAGANRTYDQIQNPYVLFSPTFENIINSDYINTKRDYKNTALILGAESNGSRRKTSIENGSGLTRRELYVDARDISLNYDNGGAIPAAKYTKLLEQRGYIDLYDHREQTVVDGEVETTRLFRYNQDFSMGDIVQVENEYGVMYTARITEMIFSQNESGYSNYPSFEIVSLNDGPSSLLYTSGHNTFSTAGAMNIFTGFKPGYISVVCGSGAARTTYVYDMRASDTQFYFTDTSTVTTKKTVTNSALSITDISNSGFALTTPNADSELWWFALSEEASEDSTYAIGEFTGGGSSTTKITCGFEPTYVMVLTSEADVIIVYNADRSTTGYLRSGNSTVATHEALGKTSGYVLQSIDNDGFTLLQTANRRYYWVAIASN